MESKAIRKFFAVFLSVTIIFSFSCFAFADDQTDPVTGTEDPTEEPVAGGTVTSPVDISGLELGRSSSGEMILMLTGDLMCDYKYQDAVYNKKTKTYDFDNTLKYARVLFDSADYVIGNLEGNIASSYPISTKRHRHRGRPYLNGPRSYLSALKKAGFDGFVMANNHNCDTYLKGLKETVTAVDKAGFRHTGLYRSSKDKHYFIVNKDGIKVAFLSYATNFNGLEKKSMSAKYRNICLSRFSAKKARAEIKKARKAGANYVIVYLHAGREYTQNISGSQKKAVQALANAGADFIVGSHPHVLQRTGYVKAGSKKVNYVYSMGNFTGKLWRKATRETAVLRLTLKKNSSGKVVLKNTQYIPCYMKDSSSEGKMVLIPEGYRTTDEALQKELDKHYKHIRTLLKIK